MKIGIIGGAGYTAGELIRLLINHPQAEIVFVHSTSNAGNAVSDVHEGLYGDTDLRFSPDFDLQAVDVVFLCAGHGFSRKFWEENKLPDHLRVIDLAQDFRDESCGYVYGLPEVNRKRISGARLIANPGCFATALQLALAPLAAASKLTGEIHVTGVTGSTGAGVKPGATTHFSWRSDNLSVYKAFEHQHLAEIRRTLSSLAGVEEPSLPAINFVPVRGDFARGIFAMTYLTTDLSEEDARELFKRFYADAPFTHIMDRPVDLKQAVNTNKALISIEKHGDKLLIISAIDNLLKGASGQAVQNFNLACGFPETLGLNLKSSGF